MCDNDGMQSTACPVPPLNASLTRLSTREIRSIRSAIQADPILTGNDRTGGVGRGLTAVCVILHGLGFDLDMVSLLASEKKGSRLLPFRRTHENAVCGYEHPEIEKHMICFVWENLGTMTEPVIEIIAYLS